MSINESEFYQKLIINTTENFLGATRKNFLTMIIALVFVILKHSLQWTGEFHLYFGSSARISTH